MAGDTDRAGDHFDTRAAAVLAHCGYDIDAALPAHAMANLQDAIAAAIRRESENAERLSAANADLLEAVRGTEDAIDDWRQRLSERDMRSLSEEERAILIVTHKALRDVIAKAEGAAQ